MQQASLTLADSHTVIPTEGNLADDVATQRLAAYEGGQQPVLIWICKPESSPLCPYTHTDTPTHQHTQSHTRSHKHTQ